MNIKTTSLLLITLLLPLSVSGQAVFDLNLKTDLESLSFTPKEAYFLYTKALNQKLTIDSNVFNLESTLEQKQKQLAFLNKKAEGPGLTEKDLTLKTTLEKDVVLILTQQASLKDSLTKANDQLSFLKDHTKLDFNVAVLKKVYEISPSKNPYPVVFLPVIDDHFSFKLSPELFLALPVEF